ncbi:MAG TPA: COQ9 family protein [Acetobacteraceae bacterium]|jgi:ubiquinone biosynthesis protein COQ9|nr:COQ9 family protein [Acetobacteraceae bacterium]
MIERSEERDSAIRAALPHVPRLGWSRAALSAGLRALGRDPVEQEWLFPRGPAGAVEAWIDLADREMEAAARAEDLLSLRIPARIRRVVLIRLEQQEPQKEAVRLGLSHLALPWNAGAAVRSVARTADSMWVAAGDTSADVSWYTRRATLAAVYGATLAYWLQDPVPGFPATRGFLDRRLADLARFQRRQRR